MRLMKLFLFLATIQGILTVVETINGVIWSKEKGNFVPIFSIPIFSKINQETLAKSRKLETHIFQGETFTIKSPEVEGIYVTDENNTLISGLVGEIWNTLSETLNFTIRPIRVNDTGVGISQPDDTFTGLLGSLQRCEYDVLGNLEMYARRYDAAQLTMPIYINRQRLYIKQELIHNSRWLTKIFSTQVWSALLLTYSVLTLYSFVSHVLVKKMTHKTIEAHFGDHWFYNFGMMVGQSYIPNTLEERPQIFEVFLGLFSCLIQTAFSALTISYMAQKIVLPPFSDMNTLVDQSSYKIVTVRDTLPHMGFKIKSTEEYAKVADNNRVVVEDSVEGMYKRCCFGDGKFAIIEGEDVKKGKGLYMCRLHPVGRVYFLRSISSALSFKFRYKKSIDNRIIMLHEYGILNALKQRWLESKKEEDDESNNFEPIDMQQVYFQLQILCVGILISPVILLLEIIIFRVLN